jgi:chaperonin GroES
MHLKSNKSGITPVRDLVLVLPEEKVKTKEGVIEIPEYIRQRETAAQVFGTVIQAGEEAECGSVVSGDRVMFAKYGGIVVKGKDDQQYRMIRDVDILAKVDREVNKEIES